MYAIRSYYASFPFGSRSDQNFRNFIFFAPQTGQVPGAFPKTVCPHIEQMYTLDTWISFPPFADRFASAYIFAWVFSASRAKWIDRIASASLSCFAVVLKEGYIVFTS